MKQKSVLGVLVHELVNSMWRVAASSFQPPLRPRLQPEGFRLEKQ